jgi:hypothetical protein
MNDSVARFVSIAKKANREMQQAKRDRSPWLTSHWRSVKILNLVKARNARALARMYGTTNALAGDKNE